MVINKSISLTATSSTDGGETIAYFNANVSASGTNSNMSIQNQSLYEENKDKVRQDKSSFDNTVYEVEDAQTPQG